MWKLVEMFSWRLMWLISFWTSFCFLCRLSLWLYIAGSNYCKWWKEKGKELYSNVKLTSAGKEWWESNSVLRERGYDEPDPRCEHCAAEWRRCQSRRKRGISYWNNKSLLKWLQFLQLIFIYFFLMFCHCILYPNKNIPLCLPGCPLFLFMYLMVRTKTI